MITRSIAADIIDRMIEGAEAELEYAKAEKKVVFGHWFTHVAYNGEDNDVARSLDAEYELHREYVGKLSDAIEALRDAAVVAPGRGGETR